MGKLVMLQQTDRVEIYQCQLQARAGIGYVDTDPDFLDDCPKT